MSVVISQQADFQLLAFDGELTIFNVRDSFDALSQALQDKPEKVIADVSAITDFDSAGLQLLLWLQQWLVPGTVVVTGSDNPVVARVLTLYQHQLPDRVSSQE